MYILTAAQMRAAEEKAVKKGMSYERLMENAGASTARIIDRRLCDKGHVPEETRVTVVCGKSNNGGDGFVIARKLCEKGYTVKVLLAMGKPITEAAEKMFSKLEDIFVQVSEFDFENNTTDYDILRTDVLVEAIFGIGFVGKADERLSKLLNLMNLSSAFKAAVDLPSGLSSDSGNVDGACFTADFTVAAHMLKPAHVLMPAAEHCGEITIAKIGIPDICFESDYSLYTLEKDEIASCFPKRSTVANKGDFGRVLSVCGSVRYQGAAYLAAMGAVRSGAGLVFAAFPDAAYPAIASKLIDTPLIPLKSNEQGTLSVAALPAILEEAEKCDVMLLGCGLGQSADTKEIVNELIANVKCPIVLDADGINLISDNIDILKAARAELILTPHPGEMARLTGFGISDIQGNRVKTAKAFADYFGVTLVLKGANTVVASPNSSSVYVNSNGNTGLSKGGSGDMLSGIIAGFAAQGVENPAICGTFVHGLAAERTAKRLSMRGMTPEDCLIELAQLLSIFE